MRQTRVIAVLILATSLTATSLFAATPVFVGQETPVAPAPVGEAFLGQYGPMVAFDGTSFLVAWGDQRSNGATYGTRISLEGALLDPLNLRLADSAGSITWNGARYLLAGWGIWGIPGTLVERDGTSHPLDHYLASDLLLSDPVVGSNGSTTLLAWLTDDLSTRVGIVEQDGPTTGEVIGFSVSAIVPWGTGFLVCGTDQEGETEGGTAFATEVSSSGAIGRTITFPTGEWGSEVRAASSGDVALIATKTSSSIALHRLDRNGDLSEVTEIPTDRGDATVAWNASDFVVAWVPVRYGPAGSDHEILATRISRSGDVLDPIPLVICTTPRSIAHLGSAGGQGRALVGWNSYDDDYTAGDHSISAAVLDSNHFARGIAPPSIEASRGPMPQVNASVTATPGGYLATWEEVYEAPEVPYPRYNAGTLLAARLDARGKIVGSPIVLEEGVYGSVGTSVATSPSGEIVVWSDRGLQMALVPRSVGAPVKRLSIPEVASVGRPAVAVVDGIVGVAVVASSENEYGYEYETDLMRLNADLTQIDTVPIFVSYGNFDPEVVPVDGAWLVVSRAGSLECGDYPYPCPPYPDPETRLSLISTVGTVNHTLVVDRAEAVACGKTCLVAWMEYGAIKLQTISRDLSTESDVMSFPATGWGDRPRALWDGSRFLITWILDRRDESHDPPRYVTDVYLASFDANGSPLSMEKIVTGPPAFTGEPYYSAAPLPELASLGAGRSLMVYCRPPDAPDAGGVPRVVSRTLTLSPWRSHGVRRPAGTTSP